MIRKRASAIAFEGLALSPKIFASAAVVDAAQFNKIAAFQTEFDKLK